MVSAGAAVGQGERAGRRADCCSGRITDPATFTARSGDTNAATVSFIGGIISIARSGAKCSGAKCFDAKCFGAKSSTKPIGHAIREPEMIAIRGGSFAMGSNDDPTERPVHQVTVKPFSIGKYPVTVQEWNECAAAKACGFTAIGKDDAPITNVSWTDAQQYAAWLAQTTKKSYRLPSEAEWEYAARGGTQTKYWWGDKLQPGMAGCKDCGDPAAEQPAKVGSFKPNPFGLHDMGGGVDQWVEDCWRRTYQGAPSDGSAWTGGDCSSHVLRSGSWKNDSRYVRPSNRDGYDTNVRYPTHGFRVALSP